MMTSLVGEKHQQGLSELVKLWKTKRKTNKGKEIFV
jgi:hypothetical protein